MSLLFWLAGCGAPTSHMQANVLAYYHTEDQLMRASPHQVLADTLWTQAYPSKAAISFFSIARMTGGADFHADGLRQVEWAHTQETSENLILQPEGASGTQGAPPVFTSFGQSSLTLGYWLAYKATKDVKYVHWADDAMEALLSLPTIPFTWNGHTFNLFYLLYEMAPPHKPRPAMSLVADELAANGLALTLLYHEPQSRYFHDASVGSIAHEQLDASLVMMDENGAVPANSSAPDKLDTYYGGITLFWATWANRYWRDSGYDQLLARGVAWETKYTVGGARTLRYYPTYYLGPVPNPNELYWRMGLFYFYGGDVETLKSEIAAEWANWPKFISSDVAAYAAPYLMFEDMGIPRSVYWK